MSTRSVYIFQDNAGRYAVYKHSDGYPTGAAQSIEKAAEYAWTMPRWEADEFGAAFVAAEKTNTLKTRKTIAKKHGNEVDAGGQVRLLEDANMASMPSDIEYLYIIRNTGNEELDARVVVDAYTVNFWETKTMGNAKLIFSTPIKDVMKAAKAYEKKAMQEAA